MRDRPHPRPASRALAVSVAAGLLLAAPTADRAAAAPDRAAAADRAVPTGRPPSAAPGGAKDGPASSGAVAPDGSPFFLRYPTDQLGVPGAVEAAELTPEGSLFTGRLELALRAGRALAPFTGGPRQLDPTGLPVQRWRGTTDAVRTQVTAFAVDAAGVPVVHVRVGVLNPTARTQTYRLGLDVGWLGAGMRETLKGDLPRAPYRFPRNVASTGVGFLQQPGDPYDPSWTTAWAGDVLSRSGAPVLSARLSPKGRRTGRTAVVRATGPNTAPDAVTGRLTARGSLPAGGRRSVDVVVPLRAVPAGHPALTDRYASGLGRLRAAWRPVLDRGMRIETPEPDLDRAWRAGILTMLGSRYRLPDGRWVQTANRFQYQASWIRDTTMIAHALDLLGFAREAGEDVEFLTRWQDESGLLRSRPGQLDGMGQALWSFGDHVARSGDRALAVRLRPAADRAMAWVAARLRTDPRWILPPSDHGDDNEAAPGHATGDLSWLAGGTRRVVALATLLGDDDRARSWTAVADAVEAVAKARTAEAAALRGGVVPPILDSPAGRHWGELWLAWPTALYAPGDPLVRATMAAAKRDEREGLARWDDRLHLYLGLRRLHTELLAGRGGEVVAGLYATLAHLTSTGGTWEQSALPGGSREVYRALGPHAWASADLLSLVHDMLVREEGDGVRLLDVVPPSWLRPGKVVRVRGARTAHGTVDVELRATSTGASLRWDATVPAGTPLRFRAPAGTSAVRLPGVPAGRRELLLPARRGALRLRWRTGSAVRNAPDAAGVRAALQASYRRR